MSINMFNSKSHIRICIECTVECLWLFVMIILLHEQKKKMLKNIPTHFSAHKHHTYVIHAHAKVGSRQRLTYFVCPEKKKKKHFKIKKWAGKNTKETQHKKKEWRHHFFFWKGMNILCFVSKSERKSVRNQVAVSHLPKNLSN